MLDLHNFWNKIFYNVFTVNPLYKDIRYNSKIHYNVNLVCTETADRVFFFIDSPMLFFGKTYALDIY